MRDSFEDRCILHLGRGVKDSYVPVLDELIYLKGDNVGLVLMRFMPGL